MGQKSARDSEKSIIIYSHQRIIIMDDVPGGLTDEEILKRAEDIKKAQEAKKAEELKRAEEIRKAEEAKKAEELKRAEEIRKTEEAKKAEELKRAEVLVNEEQARKAAEAKKAEELKRAEVLVNEEQARKAAEAKKVQDAEKAANLEKEVARLAAEKAAAEEAAKKAAAKDAKPKKSHKGLKIFGIILLLIIIFGGVVLISADVTITAGTDKSYGYDTTYNVWIPLDKELNIGGVTYPLEVNSVTYVPDQIGTLTLFWGKVMVMKVQYEVALTYLGNTNNNEAAFRMLISSDRQLPEFLISLFLSSSGVKVQSV